MLRLSNLRKLFQNIVFQGGCFNNGIAVQKQKGNKSSESEGRSNQGRSNIQSSQFNRHLYEHFQANGESVGAMVIAGTTTSGLELTLWSSSFLQFLSKLVASGTDQEFMSPQCSPLLYILFIHPFFVVVHFLCSVSPLEYKLHHNSDFICLMFCSLMYSQSLEQFLAYLILRTNV